MTAAALPILRTPRLTLRPLKPADATAIVQGVGNYDVSKWLSVVPYPYTREDADHFIAETLRAGSRIWAICDSEGLQGLGGVDPELGYWLARTAWGRGYGFEAARAIAEDWFSDPKNGDLVSGFFHGNDRSSAVLRALGFVQTGVRERQARALAQDVMSSEMVLTREVWDRRAQFSVTTQRLRLRPLEPTDAPALVRMAVPRVTKGVASVATHWSVDEARDYIAKRRWQGYPGFMLAIEREGDVIGCVGCGGSPVSIMYFLDPAHWGQGLTTEAVGAFIPELFERFPVNRIEADHFEDNPASGAILRRLGFHQTGMEMGHSKGRLEPAPVITYALRRHTFGNRS